MTEEANRLEPFVREERFIVVKRKHLKLGDEIRLRNFLRDHEIGTVECVVVESDWPEYETVWRMIEARVSGDPVDAVGAEGVASDQQRQFLEDILAGGDQARPNLYRLFAAGCEVRSVADKMYWAVRDDDPDAFKAAMAEYEQVVGLNFAVPGVQLRPFDAALRTQPVEHDALAVTLAEAFDMGRAWQFMLQGQTLEDSRAVGRTLGNDIFKPIHAKLNAAEKELGFDPFTTADLGICQAVRIIHRALSRQPVEAEGPYRSIDASGSPESAGNVGWKWLSQIADKERVNRPECLVIETPPLNADGHAAVLYRDCKPIAAYFVVRDQMNFAQLFRWRSTTAKAGSEDARR